MKRSERVYLEAYTSLLLVPKEKLVRGRPELHWRKPGRRVWGQVGVGALAGVVGVVGQSRAGGRSKACSKACSSVLGCTQLPMLCLGLCVPAGGFLWQGHHCS